MEKLNITASDKVQEIVIREGEALPLKEPRRVIVNGVLHAPSSFMQNRKELLAVTRSHLIVCEKQGTLKFVTLEDDAYGNEISGSLKPAGIIEEFGINDTRKFYADKELAKFFRKMEYFFQDKAEHKKIIASLMAFQAKITTAIENTKDTKGNAKSVFEKTVEKEVPDSFVMTAPIFEGYPAITFNVDICAEATSQSVSFYLESAELFMLEEEYKKKLLEEEVQKFRDFGCAIMYV